MPHPWPIPALLLSLAALPAQEQEQTTAKIPSAATLEREFRQAQNDWSRALRAASAAKDQEAVARLRKERPQAATFVPRFRAGAEAYASTDAAVPYLSWLASHGGGDIARTSMETLMERHVSHPGIRPAVARIGGLRRAFGNEQSRQWLDDVIAKNEDPGVQAQARYTRAAAYVGTRAVEQSDELRRFAIKDLKFVLENSKEASLRGLSERLLYEAENLEPGLMAPDIAGDDLDGIPFKLSDYKGKVVLLDFWGDW